VGVDSVVPVWFSMLLHSPAALDRVYVAKCHKISEGPCPRR
jgi:hypothetical protein